VTDPFQTQTANSGGFDPGATPTGVEEVEVDFSGTSDEFQPLEAGWYLFAVESATARDDNGGPLLSASGNPMIKWVARVVDGPRKNSPMFQYTVTKGAGAFSLRRYINQAFGSKLGKEPMRLALGPFIGKQYWGQVGPQKNDASFSEYKAFRPVNDPPPGVVTAGIAGKI
jgi:hypothetical protein